MNSRNRQILYYIFPSAGGLCVTYLYNIVDGIFVGRGVGALALAASVVIYVILVVFRVPAIRLFNSEPELVEMASGALPVFAVSFIFMAVNLIFTAYFYSTKQTWKSNIIAVSRGIVVKAAAIFCLPVLFGEGAVWTAPLAAEIITLVLAAALNKRTKIEYK